MRSKRSCFDRSIIAHLTRRYWPLWGMYAITVILMGPWSLLGNLRSVSVYTLPSMYRNLVGSAAGFGLFANLLYATAAALAVFSPLYKLDSAVMEAALPVKRETRYLSSCLAAVMWLLAVNLVAFVLMLLTEAAYGAVHMPSLFMWLGIMCLECVAFFGIAAFGVMFSGRLLPAIGIIAFIHFFVPLLVLLIKSVLEIMLLGYYSGGYYDSVFNILSPVVQLANYNVRVYKGDGSLWEYGNGDEIRVFFIRYQGWVYLAACAAVGLILLAVALWLYKRRRVESAGETIAIKCMRPFYMAAATLYCTLAIGNVLYSIPFGAMVSDGSAAACILLGLCMLAGALIGYILALMILKSTVRVFKQLRGFLIPAIAVIVFTVLCLTGMLGWVKWTPDPVKVEYAQVEVLGRTSTVTAEGDVIKLIDAHGALLEQNGQEHEGRAYPVHIRYHMTDGRTVTRRYNLPNWYSESDAAYRFEELLNRGSVAVNRCFPDTPVSSDRTYANLDMADIHGHEVRLTLDADDTLKLIDSGLIADIRSGHAGMIDLRGHGSTKGESYETFSYAEEEVDLIYADELYYIYLDIGYRDSDGNMHWIDFQLDNSAVNTIAILRQMGYLG